MWFWNDDAGQDAGAEAKDIDLYAVLNVNKAASQTEINERYRALSLLFHPDKQQSPERKEAAEDEYLKVQKAYQVLSDEFLRQVYDELGIEGVNIKWPEELRLLDKQRIQDKLKDFKRKGGLASFELDPPLTAHLSTIVDGSWLFRSADTTYPIDRKPMGAGLVRRLRTMRIMTDEFKHTVSRRINSKTSVTVHSTHLTQPTGHGFTNYNGTIRHQFSPRFTGKASVDLKAPFLTTLGGKYTDEYNTFDAHIATSPITLHQPIAFCRVSRRLFQGAPQTGEVALNITHVSSSLTLKYVSPPSTTDEIAEAMKHGIPSESGFRQVAFDNAFGVTFSGILPNLFGEIGMTVVELSTRFKLNVELGLLKSLINIGFSWVGEEKQVHFETVLSKDAVMAKFDILAWRQQYTLPIILSTPDSEHNPTVALCAFILPSIASVLSYQFIILPRRRARRIEQIRAARRALEEDSSARRKRDAVVDLLKDVANKYTSLETSKGGLVIQEALYGVTDEKDGAQDLAIDVTTPMQALVRNSHLYIPGGKSKANLQGFSDPAPFNAKSLRIRYLFRGRFHYAEIPDYVPVVLPLSEHSVGEC